VRVYGITNYVAVDDGIDLILTIGGIVSPDVDGTSYGWGIDLRRRGGFRVIQSWTGTGLDTDPKSITVNSVIPHNFGRTDLYSGLTTYVDLDFTVNANLLQGSVVTIGLTNIDASTT